MAGHLVEFQRAGGGDDHGLVDFDATPGMPADIGTGGNDDVLGFELLSSCRPRRSP
jgi:hypothetical protein